MIGDWVVHPIEGRGRITTIQDNGTVFIKTHDGIERIYVIDEIRPIPIDAEFLADNGFVQRSDRNDDEGRMETWQLNSVGWAYHFSNGDWEFELIGYGRGSGGHGSYRGVIESVHQLQHTFLLLGLNRPFTVRK